MKKFCRIFTLKEESSSPKKKSLSAIFKRVFHPTHFQKKVLHFLIIDLEILYNCLPMERGKEFPKQLIRKLKHLTQISSDKCDNIPTMAMNSKNLEKFENMKIILRKGSFGNYNQDFFDFFDQGYQFI